MTHEPSFACGRVQPRRLVALGLLFILTGIDARAQRSGVSGGVRGGMERPTAVPFTAADARMLTPAEFAASDLMTRRRTMAAWAENNAENAGPTILPLIEAGVRDDDPFVRAFSLATAIRIEGAANTIRLTNARGATRTIPTDPASYPPLYTAIFERLDHEDPQTRRVAVEALALFEVPRTPTAALEEAVLRRLRTETDRGVRTSFVKVLAERAKRGSAAALEQVLAALDDPDRTIAATAVRAMSLIKDPRALPKLTNHLRASHPLLRRAAAETLRAYGPSAARDLPVFRERLETESDPAVRQALERLIAGLEPKPR